MPLTTSRFFWDLLIIVILANYFIIIPLVIAFNKDFAEFIGIEFLHNCYIGILILDVFVNCNTAVYEKGVIVLKRRKIL